ncbi:stage II sporulation protein D [Lachnospiraceae bacterium XBB1006]|nr:stage II sporulation protein D [Lachnospiraceae bacterium XBB1006]
MKRIRRLLSISLLLMVIPLTGAFFARKEPDIEDLVLLQLMVEANPNFEPAALRAQAILIRTNIMAGKESLEETRHRLSDLMKHDITGRNFASYRKAVSQTAGVIVKVKGKCVALPYHRSSCGTTRAASEVKGKEASFLKSVACSDDILAEGFLQMREFQSGENVTIVRRFPSGYVETVKLRGKMTATMTGEAFRKEYGLASSCFYLKKRKGKVYIITKGCGHGFGMSQSMANTLAHEGRSEEEILSYFFKNLEFCRNEH